MPTRTSDSATSRRGPGPTTTPGRLDTATTAQPAASPERHPTELSADSEVADMLAAIGVHDPISLRRHRRASLLESGD